MTEQNGQGKTIARRDRKSWKGRNKNELIFLYRVMISKKSLWHGRATILIHSCGKTVGGFVFGGPRHNWRKHFPLERLQVFFVAICYAASSLLNCCRPTS
jgi:hypothetical protein